MRYSGQNTEKGVCSGLAAYHALFRLASSISEKRGFNASKLVSFFIYKWVLLVPRGLMRIKKKLCMRKHFESFTVLYKI
jgi:hypothetical protein